MKALNARRCLETLFVTLISTCSVAYAGGANGGGADPLANEFIEVGRSIQTLLTRSSVIGVNESGDLFGKQLDAIEDSLDGKFPRIKFPNVETVDCFGATKVGCVGDDGVIKIARKAWLKGPKNAQIKLQYETSSLEIFKLMNVVGRYRKARLVADYAVKKFGDATAANLYGKSFYPLNGELICSIEIEAGNIENELTYTSMPGKEGKPCGENFSTILSCMGNICSGVSDPYVAYESQAWGCTLRSHIKLVILNDGNFIRTLHVERVKCDGYGTYQPPTTITKFTSWDVTQ